MGLQERHYPLPRAKVESAQAHVQLEVAEAKRRAAVCSAPPRGVKETVQEHRERRAKHGRVGFAQSARSDAVALMQ